MLLKTKWNITKNKTITLQLLLTVKEIVRLDVHI